MNFKRSQRGVVLIMSLIMLVVVSLLAVSTMKSAISSENVSGSVRLHQLAHQAAEMALAYCESTVVKAASGMAVPSDAPAIQDFSSTPLWQGGSTVWDSENAAVFTVPLAVVNVNNAPYKRPPECLVERLAPVGSTLHNDLFAITARGFGPDVGSLVDPAKRRPSGSEVFLQSTVELTPSSPGS